VAGLLSACGASAPALSIPEGTRSFLIVGRLGEAVSIRAGEGDRFEASYDDFGESLSVFFSARSLEELDLAAGDIEPADPRTEVTRGIPTPISSVALVRGELNYPRYSGSRTAQPRARYSRVTRARSWMVSPLP
jgi:hypothetical protein